MIATGIDAINVFNPPLLSATNHAVNRSIPPAALSAAANIFVPSSSMNGARASPIASISGIRATKMRRSDSNAGVATFCPILDSAAFTFAIAPVKVSPEESAAPPMPSSIAAWKVAKSICPFDTISETSAEVFPRCLLSICKTGTPAEVNWRRSSPWSFPRAATDAKIIPTSSIDRPEIVATSATLLSDAVMSLPDLIPAADNIAAEVAAASSPKAVPFTEALAESMMDLTDAVECPSPFNFAVAFSILSALVKPPLAAIPVMAAETVPIATRPALPATLKAPPIEDLIPLEVFLKVFSEATLFNSLAIELDMPFMEGTICTYATPRFAATSPPPPI